MEKQFKVVIERKKNHQNRMLLQCKVDGRVREEFVGYINDGVKPWGKMFLEIDHVCVYAFEMSDFSSKRGMHNFIKKFAVSFFQKNSNLVERLLFTEKSEISHSEALQSVVFEVNGFEPVEILEHFKKIIGCKKEKSKGASKMNWHWDTEEIKAMIERGLKINGVKVTRSRNPNRQELDSCTSCGDLIPCGYTVKKGRKAWFVCSPGCGIESTFSSKEES